MRADSPRLLALLRPGVDNIASSYELASQLHVNQREVGYLVKDLRHAGHLIGSVHGGGYYLIETEGEYETTREHLVSRINGGLATIDKLDQAWAMR